MALSAGDRIGSYEILAPLGEGGMAEVYRARDLKLGREVAIKVLPDHLSSNSERRQRFQHEAKVLATLNHPNVATIYGLEEDGDRVSLIMELVDGTPLDARIRSRGLPLREALKIAIQIAAGLEAAHRVGVVHRDLSRPMCWSILQASSSSSTLELPSYSSRSMSMAVRPKRGRSRRHGPPRARSSEPLPTCRRSRRAANQSMREATCSASARCSTKCSPVTGRSRPATVSPRSLRS